MPLSPSVGYIFEGWLSIRQNFESTMANSLFYKDILYSCKWTNIEQIAKASGHTDLLPLKNSVHEVSKQIEEGRVPDWEESS